MRLLRFAHGEDTPRIGVRLGSGGILDASELEQPADPFGVYDLDGDFLPMLRKEVERAESGTSKLRVESPDGVRLLAPIPRPGKIVCVGVNYDDHALESSMDLPERPLIFSKFSSTICGPGDSVSIPVGSEQVDYEAELGVVIGREVRGCTEENALEAVLGYTCVNDISARDFQFSDGQWQRGKSCDGFCPIGPEIVTTDEVPDPQSLAIRMELNGTTMQEETTAEMVFDVRSIIAHISSFATLEPGDLIATGTPPGCGFAMDPPVYLASGDQVTVSIESIGELHNTIA